MSSDRSGCYALSGDVTMENAAELLASAPERIEVVDLEGVERIDSAGVALVAELVCVGERATGHRPRVVGTPEGLESLCRAYRIGVDFHDFP